MTTLTTMKDRIARELRRSNITTQIAEAITTAIDAYREHRFFFNESRDTTFSTVAAQEFYDADDEPDLANLIKIDYCKINVNDSTFDLMPDFPSEIEGASTNATATGQPGWYVLYNRQIRLYPIPDDVWTVRVAGVFIYAAPATDGETDNFWMTTAERLIRSRAKAELALHVLRDTELAQIMDLAASEALKQLKRHTNLLTQRDNGRVRGMDL